MGIPHKYVCIYIYIYVPIIFLLCSRGSLFCPFSEADNKRMIVIESQCWGLDYQPVPNKMIRPRPLKQEIVKHRINKTYHTDSIAAKRPQVSRAQRRMNQSFNVCRL